MTNLERLRDLSTSDFEDFLKKVRTDPLMEYVDWEAWFTSEDPDFSYMGSEAILYPDREGRSRGASLQSCTVLADAVVKGKSYRKILLQGRIYYVPSGRVKEVKP